jgi:hypothetical protein
LHVLNQSSADVTSRVQLQAGYIGIPCLALEALDKWSFAVRQGRGAAWLRDCGGRWQYDQRKDAGAQQPEAGGRVHGNFVIRG